jgi:hypothetical protein
MRGREGKRPVAPRRDEGSLAAERSAMSFQEASPFGVASFHSSDAPEREFRASIARLRNVLRQSADPMEPLSRRNQSLNRPATFEDIHEPDNSFGYRDPSSAFGDQSFGDALTTYSERQVMPITTAGLGIISSELLGRSETESQAL